MPTHEPAISPWAKLSGRGWRGICLGCEYQGPPEAGEGAERRAMQSAEQHVMAKNETEMLRVMERLAARLRVHASESGYRQDYDESPDGDQPGFPGRSERWSYADQRVLEDFDHLADMGTAGHSPACLQCARRGRERA